MREKLFAGLGVLAAVILVAGCQTSGERAVKLQGQSGRMNRNTDFAWYALCTNQTPGGHEGVWKGSRWQQKERAMQDALDHNKQYPGHNAVIAHD